LFYSFLKASASSLSYIYLFLLA